MTRSKRFSLILCFVALCYGGSVAAHSEHDKPRFVAPEGVDQGGCDDRFRPCATVGYAASRAAKGDRILLASGKYVVSDSSDLFYLVSGVVSVTGGYSRAEFYAITDKAAPSVLMGVPPEYRKALANRGFQVIADGKGLSAADRGAARTALAAFAQTQKSNPPTLCQGGTAGNFQCDSVDLLGHLALTDFSSSPSEGNDIWGFLDLNTGREYAVMGVRNGTAVIDVTDTDNLVEVGFAPGDATTWRDIKVHQFFDGGANRFRAYAYITADSATNRLTVIDLSNLPLGISVVGEQTNERAAHNVAIANVNFATGVAQPPFDVQLLTGGSNLDGGAFRSYTLGNPESPSLQAQSPGGYMHDGASFVVDDSRAPSICGRAACQVIADFNEGSFELYDYDNGASTLLSSTTYPQANYVHSGWSSEDTNFLFVHDELDEQRAGLNTTVRVFDISNAFAPNLAATWTGPTGAVDHNGFARGNRYYMSNYTRGLTVLDITDPSSPSQIGFFDTFPSGNGASFNGAWGVYPFLPSGKILISDIDSGLYVLRDTAPAANGQLALAAQAVGGVEGDQLSVAVSRSGGSQATSVRYRLIPGSADAADYAGSVQGTLDWAAGDTADKTIAVTLTADGVTEEVERFFVELYAPTDGASLAGPGLGQLFVADVQDAGQIGFDSSTQSLAQNASRAVLTVVRRDGIDGAMAVDYDTQDGTATAGSDYTAVSGTLNWASGDATPRTIEVPILGTASGGSEDFVVRLMLPGGGSAQATVTMQSANAAPPAPAPPSGGGGGGGGSAGWLLAIGFAAVWWRRRAAGISP